MASKKELKLNDLLKILSKKDKYLEKLIRQRNIKELNQILSKEMFRA